MEEQNNQSPEQPKKAHGRGWTIGVIVLVIILGVIVFWNRHDPAASNNGQVQGLETQTSGESTEGQSAEEQTEMPGQSEEGRMNMSTSTPPAPSADNGALNDQGQKVYTIHGGSYYFSPNQITVNKGDKVKIVFTADSGFHDFVLDEFNVKTERVSGGQTASAEFTADKTGSFEFYCSVGNHRAMGMKGQLIVQ